MSFGMLCLVCVGGVLAWWWQAGLRVREAAVLAAEQACRERGVQMLDGSVALVGLHLGLHPRGLVREYEFAFSRGGEDRVAGRLAMQGRAAVSVWFPLLPEAQAAQDPGLPPSAQPPRAAGGHTLH